jgi:hypothetical protein
MGRVPALPAFRLPGSGAARRLAQSTAMFLFRSGGGWAGGDVGGSHPRGGVSSATISRSGPRPRIHRVDACPKTAVRVRTATQINVERTVVARPCGSVVAAHRSQSAKVEDTLDSHLVGGLIACRFIRDRSGAEPRGPVTVRYTITPTPGLRIRSSRACLRIQDHENGSWRCGAPDMRRSIHWGCGAEIPVH